VIDCPVSDPQSLSVVVVVMGRRINQIVCRMAVAVLLDATRRAYVLDETK
jgi:hypothetical protein